MEQEISDYDKYQYDYEEYWKNPEINRSYEDQAERAALKKLLPKAEQLPSGDNSWFCDLGCGFGRLFDCYKDNYQNIILSDYSLENLKKAQKKISSPNPNNLNSPNNPNTPSVFYIAANAYSLPFKPEIIDCLMSVRTLHHIAESEKMIGQIRNVLKSKGYLVLEYANKRHFIEVVRGILGKSKMNPFSLEPTQRGEDSFLNFHPKYIKKILKQSFYIRKTLSVSNLRSTLIKKIIPVKAMLFVDKIFQPIFSLVKFGPSIFILAQKKDHPKVDENLPAYTFFDLLACPRCGSPELMILKNEIRCKACEKHYPIVDGIYDFRVE